MPIGNGLDSDASSGRAYDPGLARRKATPQVATSLKALCDCASMGLRQVLDSGAPAASFSEVLARVHLRDALRDVCAATHEQGLHAEELLILLKREWAATPDETTWLLTYGRNDLLRDLIALCIEEFYTSRAPGDSAALPEARRAD